MLRIALLACFLCGAARLRAADEQLPKLKVGPEVYENVTVTSVTATDIYFSHSRGLGNAKLKDLEPALQKQFHFDSAKAAATQSAQAQANAQYSKALRDAPAPKRQVETTRANASTRAVEEVPPHAIHAKSFLGQPAPAILVEKWLTEQPDPQGKFVLIDFWATWCGPCRASIPHLNELQSRFKDRLVVIGLSGETEKEVRAMTNPRIEYAIAIDTAQHTGQAVQVKGIPHAILLDPKGVVRFEGMPHYLTDGNLETLMTRYGL